MIGKSQAFEILEGFSSVDKSSDPEDWANQMSYNQVILDEIFEDHDLIAFDDFNRKLESIISDDCQSI